MDASLRTSSTTRSSIAAEESRDLSLVFLTLVLLALIVLLCLLLARRGNLLARMKRFVFRLAALDDDCELGQEEKAILTKNDQLYFSNPLREEDKAVGNHQNGVSKQEPAKQIDRSAKEDAPADIPTVRLEKRPIESPPEMASSPVPSTPSRRPLSTSSSIVSDDEGPVSDIDDGRLTRALSTESIDSQSSTPCDLLSGDQSMLSCGQLEVRLHYEKASNYLTLWVVQAYELNLLSAQTAVADTSEVWVVIFLLPHAKPLWRTQLLKGSSNPQFREQFRQRIRDRDIRKFALLCQVYSRHFNDKAPAVSEASKFLMIGQCKVRLKDIELEEPNTLWLNLQPPHSSLKEPVSGLGEILFSLHYIPSAERLSAVISKVKNIRRPDGSRPKNVLVKAYLVHSARKALKKKTSMQEVPPATLEPTDELTVNIHESMIFPLQQSLLNKFYLRLSIVEQLDGSDDFLTLGHATVGSRCSDKGFGHWNQMVRSPNKTVAMWHPIVPKKLG